ncbi:hypothetical protein KI688_005317 [Linnemannia hyalina]|uniref:AMP-activated protein kinase glycogen-binding domain-containing protein n=1 Tax=Linnemannia hyalina TaxID=64524 RepID=A0A9P7XK83_9FUNG|nr:hypothetical protein KI688_005317 [Linnemannia hyalina]
MPTTPKAAAIGNGQKIATVTPAASPAGSVARPSPSSAGMSTPAEAHSTPLSKNQKKKKSKAAKAAASAATSPSAPVAAATEPVPSTPVANVKQQQEASSSITPTVESLGLSEEKTPAKDASPIARNILAEPTPVTLPQHPKRALVAHTFLWKNGGDVVKITGTFDNWGESIVLKKVQGNPDQSKVAIDLDRSQKNLFKFIVDGQWRCSDEFPTEYDNIGNLNNVLPAFDA